jgi:nitrite reductase (NADH) large subunit
MSEPLVIVGNGMAAVRLVEELSERALGRYAIVVVGKEPWLAYNRVLLSAVLAKEAARQDIELKPTHWYRDRGVTLQFGQVRLANGMLLRFSKLVLATGSRPNRLNVPGMELPGVVTFRDCTDVDAIQAATMRLNSAVVIGGGLLGLEAAYGLAKSGLQVCIVHLMDRLMERQLDARAATMLKRDIEAKGIAVHLNTETVRISRRNRGMAVEFKDGRRINSGLVVVATGVQPNVELAHTAGLAINRGILVDDHLQSSKRGIYAIGECAEHRGVCYGLVEPAYEQARALAVRLAGRDVAYPGSVLATNLKVSGVNVFSAGNFLGSAGTEQIVLSDPGLGSYKKLVIADGRLTGAVLFGDTADGLWYLDHIRSGASIEAIRDDIAFGRALAERQAA